MPRIHARLAEVRPVLGAAGAEGAPLADSCLRDSRSLQILRGGPLRQRRVLLARVSDRWCSVNICEGSMLDCVTLLPCRYPPLGGGRRWWCTLNRHLEAGFFQEVPCDTRTNFNLTHASLMTLSSCVSFD